MDTKQTRVANCSSMLTARRSPLFERVFRVYNRNLIRRRFEGLRVAGLEHLRATHEGDAPVVLYANHSSWWDGLIACEIGMSAGVEQYAMMDERQLRDYGLFRRLGAFSIDHTSGRTQMRSIEYAASLLRGDDRADAPLDERIARRALWIFPQGRERPNDARPLGLRSGVAHIIRRVPKASLLPAAMRYEHLGDFRPEAFVRIGAGRVIASESAADVRRTTELMEIELTATLDRVRADVIAGETAGYVELVASRRRARKLS